VNTMKTRAEYHVPHEPILSYKSWRRTDSSVVY
jgi:hypothetical protein